MASWDVTQPTKADQFLVFIGLQAKPAFFIIISNSNKVAGFQAGASLFSDFLRNHHKLSFKKIKKTLRSLRLGER
jgi:hypothetical protein